MMFSFFSHPIISKQGQKPSASFTLAQAHRYITSEIAKERTEKLRSIPEDDERKKYKKNAFDSVSFAGTFSYRSEKHLEHPSGLICLDFDHVENVETLKEMIVNDMDMPAVLVFISPSGDGIKAVIRIDDGDFKENFYALSQYTLTKYGYEPDRHCSDISRACFLPYDPHAYLNETEVKVFLKEKTGDKKHNGTFPPNPSDVESIISKLEASNTDITAEYDDWVRIGFAFSEEFGERGRDYFHRVSAMYPKYDHTEAEKQYNACLKSKGSGVTIATFYYLVQEKGLLPPKNRIARPACVAHEEPKEEVLSFEKENEAIEQLPSFWNEAKDFLPPIIRDTASLMPDCHSADIFILGALAVLSGAFTNVYGYYFGEKNYANIFVLIVGMASSGKGSMKYGRFFGEHIHEELLAGYEKEVLAYQQEYKEWQENNEEGPKPKYPTRRTFFLAPNSTTACVEATLSANDGQGVIFETEADTLSSAFRSNYGGGYSAILRKAFHHETIEKAIRKENEYLYIKCPKVSLAVSGTPDQIASFVGGTQNGLASRLIFYNKATGRNWLDPFGGENVDSKEEKIKQIAEKFCQESIIPYRDLKAEFRLTAEQIIEFNHFFSVKKEELFDFDAVELIPSIHRLAVICFRLAMVLTTLTKIEARSFHQGTIFCDNNSFHAALLISKTILEHDKYSISQLPQSPISFRNSRKEKFFAALPSNFTRREYQETAQSIGQNGRTVERYIRELMSEKKIVKIEENNYKKINK